MSRGLVLDHVEDVARNPAVLVRLAASISAETSASVQPFVRSNRSRGRSAAAGSGRSPEARSGPAPGRRSGSSRAAEDLAGTRASLPKPSPGIGRLRKFQPQRPGQVACSSSTSGPGTLEIHDRLQQAVAGDWRATSASCRGVELAAPVEDARLDHVEVVPDPAANVAAGSRRLSQAATPTAGTTRTIRSAWFARQALLSEGRNRPKRASRGVESSGRPGWGLGEVRGGAAPSVASRRIVGDIARGGQPESAGRGTDISSGLENELTPISSLFSSSPPMNR